MTPEEIKAQADELAKTAKDIRTFQEKNEGKTAELETRIQKHVEEMEAKDAAHQAEMKKLTDSMATMEANAANVQVPEAEKKAEASRLFRKWMGRGQEGMPEAEYKTLTSENDPAAGYLVAPAHLEMEIIDQAVQEISPMRQLASQRSIGTDRYWVPSKSAHAATSWVRSDETSSEDTTLAYGIEDIPVHEATCLYKAKQATIDDSQFNIEGEIKEDVGEGFGLQEGEAFTTGTGIGQPEGFLSNATVVAAYIDSESSGAFTADGIFDLWGALKSHYAANAVWQLRKTAMVEILKLKTGDGTYLLTQLGNTPNWVMLGHKVIENAAMPAVAANAYALAFGDFKRGYRIIDRVGIQVIRDPYTSKADRVVEFMFVRRVGGAVICPEAIKIQKLADDSGGG